MPTLYNGARLLHRFRIAILSIACTLLTGCEMSHRDYVALLTAADSAMSARQARLQRQFRLGAYKRFDYDEASGAFVFSDSGFARVLANAEFVGEVSRRDSTWRWAWELPWVGPGLARAASQARRYGWLHGIRPLRESGWHGDDVDGWEMSSLTGWLAGAEGGYRAPSSDSSTYTFVLFYGVRWAPPGTKVASYIHGPRKVP